MVIRSAPKDNLKLPLFANKKEFFIFFAFMCLVFFLNISHEYYHYQKFTSKKYTRVAAKVISQYQKISKNKKTYHVLKLKTDTGVSFITVNWEKELENLTGKTVSLRFMTDTIDFYDYLKGFFVPTYGLEVPQKKPTPKEKIHDLIKGQHQGQLMKELFSALFIATPPSKQLREKIQLWGVSHLIALSGFHLGVLSAILYFLFFKIYTFFQDRFFPYRNAKFDLMLFSLALLFLYLIFVDIVPSLLRAYAMMSIGFFLYVRNIKIVSFSTLFLTVVILIAFFPKLLFSIGFLFSVFGVFYIFLFLHHFGHLAKYQIFFYLNFWVFFMMMPLVHYFFPVYSHLQLFSPILSMLFVVFYPLSLLFHAVGFGNLLDSIVMNLLGMGAEVFYIYTPFWFLVGFIFFSILCIFDKRFIFGLFFGNLALFLFI